MLTLEELGRRSSYVTALMLCMTKASTTTDPGILSRHRDDDLRYSVCTRPLVIGNFSWVPKRIWPLLANSGTIIDEYPFSESSRALSGVMLSEVVSQRSK